MSIKSLLSPTVTVMLDNLGRKSSSPKPLSKARKKTSIDTSWTCKSATLTWDCVTSCCRRPDHGHMYLNTSFSSSSPLTLTLIFYILNGAICFIRRFAPLAKSLNYNYRDWSQFSVRKLKNKAVDAIQSLINRTQSFFNRKARRRGKTGDLTFKLDLTSI